jgi:DNA invertase Pin-like site-specific DNA recombinase
MQVIRHRESTDRQYALADRAAWFGWPRQSIEVIDEDLGRSGATSEGRSGFARLVEAVAQGQVGAIAAIEVSRLARSSEDWQRLMSLCAVADVIVFDEQAIYDPNNRDDKLLLDIKGTMSEAELHWLSLRLTGALRNKARRGQLRITAPTGYVWGGQGFKLDPDEAVQRAVKLLFERFTIEPSAWAVLRWMREQGLLFPTSHHYSDGSCEVKWKPLGNTRLIWILKDPVYAGAYVYGRHPRKKMLVDGKIRRVRQSGDDPEQWAVKIENAHPGYIDWETYLNNQKKLRDNFQREARRGAPREGVALLQGMLICSRCGRRMKVDYNGTGSRRWYYVCGGDRDKGQLICWSLPGQPVDQAVQALWLETIVPSELELSLAVQHEVDKQADSLEKQWKCRLQQAEYEARLAERRYKAVDPDNRVVALTLESEWEDALKQAQRIVGQYDRSRSAHHIELSERDRKRIRQLAHDLPSVWNSPTTTPADRKAMLRLGIEMISLSPVQVPERSTLIRVQWRSGAVTRLRIPRPSRHYRSRTDAAARKRLGDLAASGLHDEQIAKQLNEEGFQTGKQKPWTLYAVRWARRKEKITRVAPDIPRRLPLPDQHPDGRYSVTGLAKLFTTSEHTIRRWIRKGVVSGKKESYGPYKGVFWFDIDKVTAKRLEKLAKPMISYPKKRLLDQTKVS